VQELPCIRSSFPWLKKSRAAEIQNSEDSELEPQMTQMDADEKLKEGPQKGTEGTKKHSKLNYGETDEDVASSLPTRREKLPIHPHLPYLRLKSPSPRSLYTPSADRAEIPSTWNQIPFANFATLSEAGG
jgi:hypothetical protein